MAYEKTVPDWQEDGTTIPASKLNTGWLESEKPPANWFNRFFYSVAQAVSELQTKSAEKTYVDDEISDIDTAKVDKSSITDSTGTSQDLIMSQKGVTDAIDAISGGAISSLDAKIDKSSITSSTGSSTTLVMSQKGATDGLGLKVDKSSIATATGSSNSNVASQKLVTDLNTAQSTALSNGLNGKIDKSSITSSTGSSTDAVMSQKGATDALETKVNTSSVKQSVTSGTTDVPSCVAVANYVSANTVHVTYGTVLPATGSEGDVFILYS